MKKIFLSIILSILFNLSFSQVVANYDDYTTQCSGVNIPLQINVLYNDNLNGNPVSIDNSSTGSIGNVILTIVSVNEIYGIATINGYSISADGKININYSNPYGFPFEIYVVYQICDKINPSNCSTTNAIISPDSIVIGVPDDYTSEPINNIFGGSTQTSVVSNDGYYCCWYDNIQQTSIIPGITMDTSGIIHVAPNTVPGNYLVDYEVTTSCNSNVSYSGTAQILVVSSNNLMTLPDYYQTICANDIFNVLDNDTYNNNSIDTNLFQVTTLEIPPGVTLSNTGVVTIPNTMFEDIYYIKYQVCKISDPTLCSINYVRFYFMKNKIEGSVKYQASGNCLATATNLSNIKIKNTTSFGNYFANSNYYSYSGDYLVKGEAGVNTITLPDIPPFFNVVATPSNSINMTLPCETQNVDFCVSPNSLVNDLEVLFLPKTVARPGFESNYIAIVKNIGSTILSGSITITFDETKMNFVSSSYFPSSTTTNSLTFNFNNINPFSQIYISNIKFQIFAPPIVNQNDILTFNAILSNIVGDYTPSNNNYSLSQTVVNSYDPNDINVFEGESIHYDEINNYLHYRIRFQNTGTASAINVYLKNLIDEKLDPNTFQVLSSSHDNNTIIKGNIIEFFFDNINLASSALNESLSNGYVIYRIKPKPNVIVGDIFNNAAYIYFDYNAPIITNTAITEVVNVIDNDDLELSNLNVSPNPSKDFIKLNTNQNINYNLYNLTGQKIKFGLLNPNDNTIDIRELQTGCYLLHLQSENGKSENLKVIKE